MHSVIVNMGIGTIISQLRLDMTTKHRVIVWVQFTGWATAVIYGTNIRLDWSNMWKTKI